MQGINGGDSKEEMPVTNAATARSKGEASDHTRDPSCYQGAACPGTQFGTAPLAAGLTALTRLHPVGSLKPALCVCLTHVTVGGTAL